MSKKFWRVLLLPPSPKRWRAKLLLLLPLLTACGSPDTPIDADTRLRIDSIAAAQTRLAQRELDSLCKSERTALMPLLVDSIKQVRQKEIEEQMKTVPR